MKNTSFAEILREKMQENCSFSEEKPAKVVHFDPHTQWKAEFTHAFFSDPLVFNKTDFSVYKRETVTENVTKKPQKPIVMPINGAKSEFSLSVNELSVSAQLSLELLSCKEPQLAGLEKVSLSAVKSVYRSLALKTHPDTAPEADIEDFLQLHAAYQNLTRELTERQQMANAA